MNEKDLIPLEEIDGELKMESRQIADGLGVDNSSVVKTVRKYLERMERYGKVGFEIAPSLNSDSCQKENICFLNEGQTTFLGTLSRNTEKAVEFKQKVVNSFLHYKSLAQQNIPKLPQSYKEALIALVHEVEEKEKLQLELKEAEPQIAFAKHMEETTDTISVGAFAKHLSKNGYEIGPKQLFQKFRDLKYFRYNEKNVNEPYQHVMKYGWFIFDEYTTEVPIKNGTETKNQLCQKIMVTGKGQVSITKILLRELEK
jgi:anti-repressor protein